MGARRLVHPVRIFIQEQLHAIPARQTVTARPCLAARRRPARRLRAAGGLPLSAGRWAAGVVRGLLYATAICGSGCGRQAAPAGASATGTQPARPASGVPATSGVPTTSVAPTTTDIATASVAPNCLPSHDGYLRLRMRGASNMDIDWHDADMQCEGGPRPGQQGLRLTFLGPGQHGERNLRFVFGIAASPGARSAHNVPTNVTVIFEGEHKLFSTAGDGKCTIDEFSEERLPGTPDAHLRRLSARGFCTAPATAVAGRSGLLLSRFDFAGLLLDEDDADESIPARP